MIDVALRILYFASIPFWVPFFAIYLYRDFKSRKKIQPQPGCDAPRGRMVSTSSKTSPRVASGGRRWAS